MMMLFAEVRKDFSKLASTLRSAIFVYVGGKMPKIIVALLDPSEPTLLCVKHKKLYQEKRLQDLNSYFDVIRDQVKAAN